MRRPTRPVLLLPFVLAACLGGLPAAPAGAALPVQQRAQLDLAADRTAYAPGSTARLAALVEIEERWHVNAHVPTFDYLIPTELAFELPAGWAEAKVDYPPGEKKTFAFADQPLAVYDGTTTLFATLKVPAGAGAGPVKVRGRLQYQACNDSSCLPPTTREAELTLTVGEGGEPANVQLFRPPAAPSGAGAAGAGRAPRAAGSGLAWMLLLALAGGLVLNAMPCVLPVLSLKVFGLVQSAGQGRQQVTAGALATAAGIIASFLALAGAAVAAKAAGAAVGWGIQFQRPGFVTLLTVIVVLFCLNLWGLFEIRLPWRVAQAAGSAGPREGTAGHFVSGLFATLMATPCSAPFLGTAIGFALAQSAGLIFAIFLAVGLGMSLPYLVLAAWPGAAKLLPKPGAWMERLRGILGFLLAAAAIWLLYVLSAQVPATSVALVELGLLLLALFLWLRHHLPTGSIGSRLAVAGAVATVVATLALPLAAVAPGAPSPGDTTQRLIAWQPFDRAQAEELAAAGRTVFVDVTADWCFTCKFNERLVIETPEVADAFARHDVVPMKADWTNRNDAIAQYLADHGRYGIPFYALYRPGADPHVFSELLTKQAVLTALDATPEARVSALPTPLR